MSKQLQQEKKRWFSSSSLWRHPSTKKMRQWQATHHHLVEAPATPIKNFVESTWAQKESHLCGSTNNKNKDKKWIKGYLEAADETLVASHFSRCSSNCWSCSSSSSCPISKCFKAKPYSKLTNKPKCKSCWRWRWVQN